KAKSKKEALIEQIAAAVDAGREVVNETVDFSDPNRPKTCLEVDFPILPINQIAANEGNAGKPIYQMSKWWARRRSSVFRAMLVAWFVAKNEMAQVNIEKVKRLLADLKADVKPLVVPYYACEGPLGEKGKWFKRNGTRKTSGNAVQLSLGQGASPGDCAPEDN